MNPKRKWISERKLNETWQKIREEYYKESNPSQYESDLKKANRINALRNELVGCSAAISYYELTGEIHDAFKSFGYTVTDAKGVAKVRQKLLVKKTKLNLLIASQRKKGKESDTNEAIDFYGQLADLENAIGRNIDIDKTMTIRWINYIKQVKRQNEQRKNT